MAADAEWTRDGKIDTASAVSGLTSLDDDTDDFGRVLVQHARDEHRLDMALDRNRQPFSRARVFPRIASALEQLNEPADQRSVSSGASESGAVEITLTKASPPRNVPRDWGRKARYNSDWLKRFELDTQEPPRSASANAIERDDYPSARQRREILEWSASSRQPVQSTEDETPLSSRRRYVVRSTEQDIPSSSADRRRHWETEQDFTAGSILESTPADTSRAARRQEVHLLRQRALATDRLSRISERETPQSIKDRLQARLSRTAAQPVTRRRRASPSEQTNGAEHATSAHQAMHSANGNRVLYKNAFDGQHLDGSAVTGEHNGEEKLATQEYDAKQLLKRLAKATSKSPSPVPHISAAQRRQNNRQISAQAPEALAVQETPRNTTILDTKTPKILGGWIDTPHTIRHDSVHPPSEPAKLIEPIQSRPLEQVKEPERSAPPPDLPKSALQRLLHPTRTSGPDQALNVGDETLASLEGLLDDPTTTLGELSATLNLDDLKSELARLQSAGRPLSAADAERQSELHVLEGMGERLRAARKGVRDAGRGLRDVERRVDDLTEAETFTSKGGECAVCHGSILQAMGSEIVGWFIRSPRKKGGRRGFTKLGALLISVLAWWLLENWACAMYCQPLYAHRMKGFGVNPSAPEYPFVIPTLLFQPVSFIWRPLVWVLSSFLTAAYTYLSIPFEDDIRPPPPAVTPSFFPLAAPWPTPPETPLDLPDPQDDYQLRQVRGADAMSDDAIDSSNTKSRFAFARLWSWASSAEEPEPEPPMEPAMPVQHHAQDTRVYEYDYGAWPTGVQEEEDEVEVVNTAGLWAGVEGMAADEEL